MHEAYQKVKYFDGRLESTELIQLLYASNQKPLRFEIFRDIETRSGLSIHSFRTGGSLNMDAFTNLASNLKALCLTLESVAYDPVERKSRLFTQFLQEATRLEVLVLEMPWATHIELYRLNDIFDPIEAWIRPTLTKLTLDRLSGSYRDLARLLFLNLQKLKHLHFSDIMLLNGCWEDIIEELRQIVPLSCCTFNSGLYYANVKRYKLNDAIPTEEESTQFLATNSEYVLMGGIHPRAPMYVPSRKFQEDVAHWKRFRGGYEEERVSG
ncbi:MAG: hypothetical protein Q9204_004540 [Flavoplaca sp. TL-2023a]